MCDEAVRKGISSLMYAPDSFVREQQIGPWDDDDFLKWHKDKCHDDYQKRKAQKARIKEEFLPIAWHPDRMMDWCMSEDEKRQWR